MSVKQNTFYQKVGSLSKILAKRKFTRNGVQLSRRDAATWTNAVILTAIVWTDLLSILCAKHSEFVQGRLEHRLWLDAYPYLNSQSETFVEDVAIEWVKTISKFDVLEVVGVLKDTDAWYLSRWEDHAEVYFGQFKTWLHEHYQNGPLILGPWSVVLTLSDGRVSEPIGWCRAIHQALAIMSRVSLRDYKDDAAVQQFIDHDASLKITDYALAGRMNRIIRDWLKGFSVTSLPHHGSGAVAEKGVRSLFDKYKHVGIDSMLTYVLSKYYESELTWEELTPPWPLHPFERCSRWKQVPKTAQKRRNICMEPTTLMWFQQAVKDDLYRFMHRRLRRRIDLKDQSKNRMLACEGSVTGKLATIDLSAASDSVSWELVRICFKGTALLPWLFATRSRYISLPKTATRPTERIRAKKFAPMGSALCFPIECLVFAAVCEDTIRQARVRHSKYRVYGDDIIIESELVDEIVGRLESLGFTVNRDKSFVTKSPLNFRESCGGEYLHGYDITPARIPRTFSGERITVNRPDLVSTLVEMANAFYDIGLIRARRWILHKLRALPRGWHPSFGGCMLSGDVERNYLSALYHDRNLQTLCEMVGLPSGNSSLSVALKRYQEESDPFYEDVRLYHWMTCHVNDNYGETESTEVVDRFGSQSVVMPPSKFWRLIDTASVEAEVRTAQQRLLQPVRRPWRPATRSKERVTRGPLF